DDNTTQLVGMFRRESVVAAYHVALGTSTDRHLYRDRVRVRTQPGASFFDAALPQQSPLAGRAVSQVPWPADATLVSIRRGASVLIPRGQISLEVGDTLTLFGTGESREEVNRLIESGSVSLGDQDRPS
ncbi:MAG: TrkA C-terminal domain-containing protein, partial [Acidimicrobiia bacterium]|nr:TrkA C-terminal domain-containing protein [Acidimicrobiia bacterium]MDX2466528.1 TrkA C-terminal domain-containing protein [Acidimicrobiia bacterium]